jgi:hypothetical protein
MIYQLELCNGELIGAVTVWQFYRHQYILLDFFIIIYIITFYDYKYQCFQCYSIKYTHHEIRCFDTCLENELNFSIYFLLL